MYKLKLVWCEKADSFFQSEIGTELQKADNNLAENNILCFLRAQHGCYGNDRLAVPARQDIEI